MMMICIGTMVVLMMRHFRSVTVYYEQNVINIVITIPRNNTNDERQTEMC